LPNAVWGYADNVQLKHCLKVLKRLVNYQHRFNIRQMFEYNKRIMLWMTMLWALLEGLLATNHGWTFLGCCKLTVFFRYPSSFIYQYRDLLDSIKWLNLNYQLVAVKQIIKQCPFKIIEILIFDQESAWYNMWQLNNPLFHKQKWKINSKLRSPVSWLPWNPMKIMRSNGPAVSRSAGGARGPGFNPSSWKINHKKFNG